MDELIKHFGGRVAMAEFFGVDRAAITQWTTGAMPPKRAIQIEEFTHGVFTAVQLMEWNKELNDKN